MRKLEIIFSANYFGFDDTINVDGEKNSDTISAIPFEEMEDMTPREFTANQKRFKNCSCERVKKPSSLEHGTRTTAACMLFCGSFTQYLGLSGLRR